MGNLELVLLAVIAWTFNQQPQSVQFRHLCTYGSKYGIHAPGALNGRVARLALGNPDNPYGVISPSAVTTDGRRRVWIADAAAGLVHVFDRTTGAYHEIRRVAGILLRTPSGLTSDNQGRVYLADAGNGGVFVFDEKGEYDHALIRPGDGLLQAPAAIALSENGRTIYVADPPRNVIVALNREGEVNETIDLPPEYSGPAAISVVDNQIYVLGRVNHKIGVFSPAGRLRGEFRWDGVAILTAFAFDPVRRQFLVADARWMVVDLFNMEGKNLANFGQRGDGVDQMQRVDALYADDEGSVYIIDTLHGKVLVFMRLR